MVTSVGLSMHKTIDTLGECCSTELIALKEARECSDGEKSKATRQCTKGRGHFEGDTIIFTETGPWNTSSTSRQRNSLKFLVKKLRDEFSVLTCCVQDQMDRANAQLASAIPARLQMKYAAQKQGPFQATAQKRHLQEVQGCWSQLCLKLNLSIFLLTTKQQRIEGLISACVTNQNRTPIGADTRLLA